MLHRALGRWLAPPDSPTADLYFLNACGSMIGAGVERLGATVFASHAACLVMRHDLCAGAPLSRAGRRLIYFIDDAVEEGARDRSLPYLYRQKLRLVECAAERRVGRRAAVVVVSSPALARRFAGRPHTHVLHPYWSEPFADLSHFDADGSRTPWIEIAYLGSAVHRADLEFLWPVIAPVLGAHPRVRFHLSERHRVPLALGGHPRIRFIPARSWSIYRAALRGRHFHVALYPLLDTPFNRARSVNKLIEHGLVGAAPLYSRSWPEARRAAAVGAGLLLENSAQDWRAAIEALLARPAEARQLAARASALARAMNRPDEQQRLWARLLEVDCDAAA